MDTRNWGSSKIEKRKPYPIRWIDIKNRKSPGDDLRYQGHNNGCAQFARPEGMWHHGGEIFFTCTSGGENKLGQIGKYKPSPDEGKPAEQKNPATLELFFESDDAKSLDMCDNITVAPWGDVIICEDGRGVDHLVGIRPSGKSYRIAKNALNKSEFAGACFSHDGNTLFIIIYKHQLVWYYL